MGSKWTMVRLRQSTRERLADFLASQLLLAYIGKADVPESGSPGGGNPSVDWIVNQLLNRVDAHRNRARKARKRRGIDGQLETLRGNGDEAAESADVVLELTPAGLAEVDQAAARDRDNGVVRCCKCLGLMLRNVELFDGVPQYWCSNCSWQEEV